MIKMPSSLIYCHHSVGIGHLMRSLALARSLSEKFEVAFISGGEFPQGFDIPENIKFIQLPAVKLNEHQKLVDAKGEDTIIDVMRERGRITKEAFLAIKPDILITEFFPFGRVQFSGEIVPLLKLAKKMERKPLIFSSIRDIMEPFTMRKKMFQDFACSISNDYYDGVLFHSDPSVCKLEESFDYNGKLNIPVHYTGFVGDQSCFVSGEFARNGVVASFGGGAAGIALASIIVQSYKKYGFGEGVPLRLIAGPLFPEDNLNSLLGAASDIPGLTIIKQVNNLSEELNKAAVSISQCGYNTAIEILNSRVPAIVVPYKNENNSEQVIRAEKLNDLLLVRHIDFEMLTAESIANEVHATMNFKPDFLKIDLNGSKNTTALLLEIHFKNRGVPFFVSEH